MAPCVGGELKSERDPSKAAWSACRAKARDNQPAFAQSGFGVAALASLRERRLVGLGRFELPTSRLSSARSNQLSYRPNLQAHTPEPAPTKVAGKRMLHRPWVTAWARPRRKRNVDGGVPLKGHADPETGRSRCVPKRSDRAKRDASR